MAGCSDWKGSCPTQKLSSSDGLKYHHVLLPPHVSWRCLVLQGRRLRAVKGKPFGKVVVLSQYSNRSKTIAKNTNMNHSQESLYKTRTNYGHCHKVRFTRNDSTLASRGPCTVRISISFPQLENELVGIATNAILTNGQPSWDHKHDESFPNAHVIGSEQARYPERLWSNPSNDSALVEL